MSPLTLAQELENAGFGIKSAAVDEFDEVALLATLIWR